MSTNRARKRASILSLKLALEDESVSLGNVKNLYKGMRELLVTARSFVGHNSANPHSRRFVVDAADQLFEAPLKSKR